VKHNIKIDVTRLLGRFMDGRLPTGVDRVCLAYIRHYGCRAHAVVRWAGRANVMPKAESEGLFQWLQSPASNLQAYRTVVKGILRGWPLQSIKGCFLLNTGHSGLEQASYPAMLKRQMDKPIFMVHDLIPIAYPEYCRPGERQKHEIRMRNVLGFANGIVCNSQATLDTLADFAEESGLPLPPATVALLASGVSKVMPRERPIVAPYFVMLSTIEPRKNHWLLLHVWRRLVERLGDAAPRLVIIGQRGWECENVVDILERCEPLKGVVIELSACLDVELATYLQHAQALLFPSFAEGYGMPLVEALTLGLPVIASDLPVFKEIAGDIPDYIDPLDGLRWDELVYEYARPNSRARYAQLARLASFKAPAWADHFDKVDALLERLN
jgi:glycosyltransferase involved in cell wall biosynthesis